MVWYMEAVRGSARFLYIPKSLLMASIWAPLPAAKSNTSKYFKIFQKVYWWPLFGHRFLLLEFICKKKYFKIERCQANDGYFGHYNFFKTWRFSTIRIVLLSITKVISIIICQKYPHIVFSKETKLQIYIFKWSKSCIAE